MSENPTAIYAGGGMRGEWRGAALSGACPVCRTTDSGFKCNTYQFPVELEDAARTAHGPSHSSAEYAAEVAQLDEFVADARVAFDDMLADLAARRARIVTWSATEGVSTDEPE